MEQRIDACEQTIPLLAASLEGSASQAVDERLLVHLTRCALCREAYALIALEISLDTSSHALVPLSQDRSIVTDLTIAALRRAGDDPAAMIDILGLSLEELVRFAESSELTAEERDELAILIAAAQARHEAAAI